MDQVRESRCSLFRSASRFPLRAVLCGSEQPVPDFFNPATMLGFHQNRPKAGDFFCRAVFWPGMPAKEGYGKLNEGEMQVLLRGPVENLLGPL